jgi:hypothetical protein
MQLVVDAADCCYLGRSLAALHTCNTVEHALPRFARSPRVLLVLLDELGRYFYAAHSAQCYHQYHIALAVGHAGLISVPYFAFHAKKYAIAAIGCPKTQNDSQNMRLPTSFAL